MFFRIFIAVFLAGSLGFIGAKQADYKYVLNQEEFILDSSKPLPQGSQFKEETKQTLHNKDIDEELESIKPSNPAAQFHANDSEQLSDIDFRIHELQKEIYFLEGQFIAQQEKHNAWKMNRNRSGIIMGIGLSMDFVDTLQNFGIKLIHVNYGAMFKVGYLKYFNNNLGLKAEIFDLYGYTRNTISSAQDTFINHIGLRFSFLQDIEAVKSHFLGMVLGIGFGANFFNHKTNLGANFHIGVSYSFGKRHRMEVERIFLTPFSPIDYQNTYVVSYSFIW